MDEWDKFEFSGKKEQKVLNYCVAFVWGEKLGWPRTLFIILLMRLGVSKEAVEKVLRKNRSGLLQTPNGKVKIQKLKPGEKPTLPAVRVLWNDDTEKQDFVSFAAAAKELKIHPKTIPSALKAGRDSFTRKSDGKKFTFEIPQENTPSRKKPKPPSEEQKAKLAEEKKQTALKVEVVKFYDERVSWHSSASYKKKVEHLEKFWPGVVEGLRRKVGLEEKPQPSQQKEEKPQPPQEEKPQPPQQKEEKPQPPQEEKPQPPQQKEEKLSEESSSAKARCLPSPLGGRFVPVNNELGPLAEKFQRATDNYYNSFCLEQGKPKLEETFEELELQLKFYYALREKYAGWYLDDIVDDSCITKAVIYNPKTGEDFLVEDDDYDLIAQFFLSRGYVDFLSEDDFNHTWCHGKIQFPAKKSNLPEEDWMLYNFIRDS